jgi:Flp pilus assembly protein TadD
MTEPTAPPPATPDEIARLHAAVARLPEAAAVDEGSARSFGAAARTALGLGFADDAIVLARAALALAPDDARAWSVLGEALWVEGRAAEARVALEEAVGLDDKDLTVAVACARAQAATGAVTAARALLTFVLTRTHSAELRGSAVTLLETLGGAHPAVPADVGSAAPAAGGGGR